MKIIQATLKNAQITSVADITHVNFNDNIILASSTIERTKKEFLHKTKELLHNKIATLSLDDLDFEVIELETKQ